MSAWASKNLKPFAIASLAAIAALVVAQDVHAGCGSSHMPDDWTPSDVRPSLSNEAPTWVGRLGQGLEHWWTSISKSVIASTCQRCPHDPATPGKRCEGPSCSGDVPPNAAPVRVVPDEGRDPIVGLILRDTDRAATRGRFIETDDVCPRDGLTDTIFHPPRSV